MVREEQVKKTKPKIELVVRLGEDDLCGRKFFVDNKAEVNWEDIFQFCFVLRRVVREIEDGFFEDFDEISDRISFEEE